MSQVMKWHYKGEADITLGEIYISPLPKILAIIIISMVSLISIAGYVYRYFIYDFIINPHIVLLSNEINIPYNSDFDPIQYIDTNKTTQYDSFIDTNNIIYEMSCDNPVDTKTLGTYTVTYDSNNRLNKNKTTLTVNVVDTEKPIIEIVSPEKPIPLMKDDFNKLNEINVLDYIDNAGEFKLSNCVLAMDNYSSEDNLVYDFSSPIEGSSNDYIKTYSIDVAVIDENNNIATNENSSIIVSFQLVVDNSEYQSRINELEKENASLQNTKPTTTQVPINNQTTPVTNTTSETPAVTPANEHYYIVPGEGEW